MKKTVDQEKYEAKITKKLLARYRRSHYLSYERAVDIENFDEFSMLDGAFQVGGYKQGSAMTLGALLNSLEKSAIGKALYRFLQTGPDANYAFVFTMPSSTADYVIVRMDAGLTEMLQSGLRFVSFVKFANAGVAVMRLDDYLNIIWPETNE